MRISLNGKWDARTDAEEDGLARNWAASPIQKEVEINVPGCIQQLDELAEEYPPIRDMRNSYKGVFFAEKEVCLPTLKEGERCRLYIGGVIPSCHIWINGKYTAKNILGLNRIELDITEYIVDGMNRITVAVTEQYDSLITGMRFAGINWSGIYSEVYTEISGAICFKDLYIALKDGQARLCGAIRNDGPVNFNGDIDIALNEKRVSARICVGAGCTKELDTVLDIAGLPRWSYRDPQLIDVTVSCRDYAGNPCECRFKTGLREIAIEKDRILVDGNPTFFAGTGAEYYSPTISPLVDREILIKRYEALKAYGFNFYRCHTHVPTEEEMCVADEMGIMLSVEFGIVSNFNKMQPVEKAMEMLEQFIRQSRKHPSVFVYCLGNEGSQLMVDSYIERNKAKAGYRLIKKNTDNQMGIIAFGMQGELPELENDFETPHLWSDNFLWAYDGLTDIPWEDLRTTIEGKPCIIHEYGKFGVWPSRKEEQECTVEEGSCPDYGTQGYEWLKENGLEELEDRLVSNSRKAANLFNRIILEDARRQPYCSGYALWTFFRGSSYNAGLADDLGKNLNGDTELFRTGANADVAILMNRGFLNRTFPCEIRQSIDITVSNFGTDRLSGLVEMAVCCGRDVIETTSAELSIGCGETKKAGRITFCVPAWYSGRELELIARFTGGQGIAAENKWKLWAFDTSCEERVRAYLHVDNLSTFRALKKVFPNAQRLSSVDSVIIGCRSWTSPRLAETAEKDKSVLIIADTYDDVVKDCIQKGCKVLLIDGGNLPDEWMLEPICEELGERDTGRFYNSFRAGWDKGNLVTLIREDCLLGEFPQDGFCDVQFYDMMQSARIMKPEIIETVFGVKAKRIISSFSKVPATTKRGSVVQDPNAIKEQKVLVKKVFRAREQGYYLKLSEKLAICTLKLTDNCAGIALLKEAVACYDKTEG